MMLSDLIFINSDEFEIYMANKNWNSEPKPLQTLTPNPQSLTWTSQNYKGMKNT